MNLKDKIIKYIEDKELIKSGDRILVALSGGPDSIFLTNILIEISKNYNLKIAAAHINHMLRGKEADEDEAYVRSFCEKAGIDCFVKRVDINRIVKERGISSEMAGREERYKFFEELKKEHSYDKIALAHNLNDQAETILMRLMRGTGLEGLVGIKAKRDDIYIRPILCIERNEIEKYCLEKKLKPRIDKTNLENIYSRNKVRLELIPYIKENFNSDIINTINRLGILLSKDEEFINEYVEKSLDKYCDFKDELKIGEKLFLEKEALLTRTLKSALVVFSKKHFDFEMKHIYDIITLQENKTGTRLSLPHNLEAVNVYKNVIIRFVNTYNEEKSKKANILLKKEELNNNIISFNEYDMEFTVSSNEGNLIFSDDSLVKYFDYDKISKNIEVRLRKDGDRMKPLGMSGRKKIKDIFIDFKIPKDNRDFIPIVCFDDEIAWVVGIKTSEEFKINKSTKKILKIKLIRKEQ